MELFKELMNRYRNRLESNPRAYEEISDILEEMRPIHRADALTRGIRDIDQSWRAWKGNNYEKFVREIVASSIEAQLPLKVIRGSILERRTLNNELSRVKRNLLVDFGEQGSFLPDADIVVYSPSDGSVKAVISCKVTLRERVAQAGYWKLRLLADEVTEHIKVLFATPDEDSDLMSDRPNKSKAIALHELDGTYVLRRGISEKPHLKALDQIVEELQ
jgi:type II restriction enzyme